MTKEVMIKSNNLPTGYEEEADTLLAATEGHEKLLKFVKGKYKVGDDEVPLGTQYVGHPNQLTYCWIKFRDTEAPTGRIVAAYDYADDKGELLYQVVRLEPKDFRQRRPD